MRRCSFHYHRQRQSPNRTPFVDYTMLWEEFDCLVHVERDANAVSSYHFQNQEARAILQLQLLMSKPLTKTVFDLGLFDYWYRYLNRPHLQLAFRLDRSFCLTCCSPRQRHRFFRQFRRPLLVPW